jgi:hypothetical protein
MCVQAHHYPLDRIAVDGEYLGLEQLPSLSPEDSDTTWFHENRLIIRNDEAILDKVPVTIRRGKKTYSASDGGFLTYRARFIKKGSDVSLSMRLFESMYILFPVGKNDQYTKITTLPVKFVSGQIEINGVKYRRTVLDNKLLNYLLDLLSKEALEKPKSGHEESLPRSNN